MTASTLRCKNPFETGDVAVPGRRDEGVEQASGLRRPHGQPSIVGDVLAGAGHHLAGIGLLEPQDVGDVAVGIIERLAMMPPPVPWARGSSTGT